MSDAPIWLEAIGTDLAFAITLIALLREMSIRRRATHEEIIHQARLVIVGEPVTDQNSQGTGLAEYIQVWNYSAAPIFELDMRIEIGDESGLQEKLSLRTVLGPGEHEEFEFDTTHITSAVCCTGPTLYFVDAAGRRWRRTESDIEPRQVFDYIQPGLLSLNAEGGDERLDRSRLGKLIALVHRWAARAPKRHDQPRP